MSSIIDSQKGLLNTFKAIQGKEANTAHLPKADLRPSDTLKEFERIIDGKSPEAQKGRAGERDSRRPPALPEMSSPPMRGMVRNNSVAQYDETPFNEDRKLSPQRGELKSIGSARGPHMQEGEDFARDLATSERVQQEMARIVSKGSALRVPQTQSDLDLEKFVGEDAFRSQIEELVRQQLQENENVTAKMSNRKGKLAMGRTAPAGSGLDKYMQRGREGEEAKEMDEQELKKNIMGMIGEQSRTDFFNTRNRAFDLDAKSDRSRATARSGRSGKTMLTTKSKFIERAKMQKGMDLAPVGMQKSQSQAEEIKVKMQVQVKQMLNSVLKTETLVEKLTQVVEDGQDDIGDWAPDSEPHKDILNNLSYTKMKNEINHREPRTFSKAGLIIKTPICFSSSGCHCTYKSWRKTDMENLGLGVNLYFKMLKYFGCVFFCFFLLSLFPMILYLNGNGYAAHPVPLQKFTAGFSIGNLNLEKEMTLFNYIPTLEWKADNDIEVECPADSVIGDLMHFGLAYKDKLPVGVGLNVTIDTVDGCTYGTTDNMNNEFQFNQRFQQECVGKQQCTMSFTVREFFDQKCQKEIDNRGYGNTENGPNHIYGLALCKRETITLYDADTDMAEEPWPREKVARFVVWMDIIIVFLFVVAVYRLKFYQDLTVVDFKRGSLRVDDFSVYLPEIPLDTSDYNNNIDLLRAMIVTHLEDIVENEPQVIEEMEDDVECQSQIVSVHFGMTSQHSIQHLVNIWNAIKQVNKLQKQMKNDPTNVKKYEKKIWELHVDITDYKDAYYLDKEKIVPRIKNAYITFRSMEGSGRAVQAYDTGNCARICIEQLCCMKFLFKKKKLLRKSYLTLEETVEPGTIVWENLGNPLWSKVLRILLFVFAIVVLLCLSFALMVSLGLFEKLRVDFVKSDCGHPEYTQAMAYDDFTLPFSQQQGFMHCYCQQMYNKYGPASLKITFLDNDAAAGKLSQEQQENFDGQYCKLWYPTQYDSWSDYAIAGYLALANLIIHVVINYIGQYSRPKSVIAGRINTAFWIFFTQYINTAILFVLCYNSLLSSSEKIRRNDIGDIFTGPFDEFNIRWYSLIGSPMILTILFQIVTPHLGVVLTFLWKGVVRCFDRNCTCNERKTKQVIQSDYEDLYTGPEFILQIRYAQLLTMIFFVMTYSSGMPILYLIMVISLFFTFWVDKILLLRYFRLTPGYTKHMAEFVVGLLPIAAIIHLAFGIFMFSYPYVLRSKVMSVFKFNLGQQYFNDQRINQEHMIIYFFGSLFILVVVIFEKVLTKALGRCTRALFRCVRTVVNAMRGKEDDDDYDSELICSDDIYQELDFRQLQREYSKIKKDRQRYKLQVSRGGFSELQKKKYVTKYIEAIERNEEAILKRLIKLTDIHIDRIEGIEPDMMTEEQKIKTVLEYYNQATDKDNPLRGEMFIDDMMHGRMPGTIQSYDLMDNQKYRDLESLLDIMKETFGFNQDMHGLFKSEVFAPGDLINEAKSQAHDTMGRRKIALDALDGEQLNEFNASIKSNQPLVRNDSGLPGHSPGSPLEMGKGGSHTNLNKTFE